MATTLNRPGAFFVDAAKALAKERKHLSVDPVHLLYRLVEQSDEVRDSLLSLKVEPRDLLLEAEAVLRSLPKGGVAPVENERLLDVQLRSQAGALRSATAGTAPSASEVTAPDLLKACLDENTGPITQVWDELGVPRSALRNVLQRKTGLTAPTQNIKSSAKTDLPVGLLHDFSADVLSRRYPPTIGREAEVRRVIQVLARNGANAPILVGESGIGRTALVRLLTERISEGQVPNFLARKKVWLLEPGALAVGTRTRAEVDERMRAITQQLAQSGDVLFIQDLGSLMTDQGAGPIAVLAGALSRGDVCAIASASPPTLQKLSQDAWTYNQFVRIDINTATVDESIEIIRGVSPHFEGKHGVPISESAILASAKLAKRYLPSIALPKSALDLLDEAAAAVRIEQQGTPHTIELLSNRKTSILMQLASLADETDPTAVGTKKKFETELSSLEAELTTLTKQWKEAEEHRQRVSAVESRKAELESSAQRLTQENKVAEATAIRFGDLAAATEELRVLSESRAASAYRVESHHVAEVISEWTGIPVSKMLASETEKLIHMEAKLKERIVGQDNAVALISKAVRRGRLGLRDPKRPIGSFLFLGPTGVGKTELAKALAEFLFDDEASLTRLDMSEFMEKSMVARLLGAPPGYVDSDQGGFLTEAVRQKPYSVILFDEVEKAHPDVFNILLQVLDDGRLTDARGRLSYFADTVIILTSNIGGHRILEDPPIDEASAARVKSALDVELRKQFRPEFLNRLDDIVIFKPLGKPELAGIAEIQLRGLTKLLSERFITLDLTAAAKSRLVDLGYEPGFGARPLRRALVKNIQDPLAEAILQDRIEHSTAKVDVEGEDFKFTFVPNPR